MKKSKISFIAGIAILVTIICFAICALNSKKDINHVDSIYKDTTAWENSFQVEKYAPNKEITGNYNQLLAAECNNGTFVGYKQDKVSVWKGVPYAKQPVNELRFKQAQAPDDNDKVYEALHFGHSCCQAPNPGEKASLYEQGEDCLTLNVWSSLLGANEKKPILVYIHGGGWVSGGSADPLYNGYNFANYNPDIMLVTINYRTGMMGMINLEGFQDGQEYNTSINNSVLDMCQALKWLKENGAAFGGDTNNITICGESAGGGAVSALCIMDQAKGLFNKAIAMSGGVDQIQSKENSYAMPKKLQEDFNIKSAKELANIPFNQLQEWWNTNGEKYCHHIIRDGNIIPQDPIKAYQEGKANDILMLQGATTNEFAYYISVFHYIFDIYDKACDKLTEACLNKANNDFKAAFEDYKKALKDLGYKDQDINNEFASDKTLQFINTYQAECQSNNNKNGYCYAFDIGYDGDFESLGAAHAVDCHYTFGNFDGNHALGYKQEVDTSRKFMRMLANFCKNADPSIDNAKWEQYNSNSRYKMLIRKDAICQVENYQGDRIDALCRMEESSETFRYAGRMGNLISSVLEEDPDSYYAFIIGELIAQSENR